MLRGKIQKLHRTIMRCGEAVPPVGSEDYGGIAGTFITGSKKLLIDLIKKGDSRITGFVDLGSGTGEVVYTIAMKFDGIPSIGVEASSVVHDQVMRIHRYVCSESEIENHERIQFMNQNILDITSLDSRISHVFSFATGMPIKVFQHIIDLIITSSFVKQTFLVYPKLVEETIKQLFKEKKILNYSKHKIKMAGSNQSHTMWEIQFY